MISVRQDRRENTQSVVQKYYLYPVLEDFPRIEPPESSKNQLS